MAIGLAQRLRLRIYGRESMFPERASYPEGSPQWVLRNIVKAHLSLRLMIGTVAILFPFVLLAIGSAFGLDIPGSISEYYWYPSAESDAPVRVFFIGGLYAIGAFLIGYRGYTKGENWLHTLAGLCAICVATLPMVQDSHADTIACYGNILYGHPNIHGGCAAGIFIFLAIAIFKYSDITLNQFGNPQFERVLRRIYYFLAGSMIVLPLLIIMVIKGFLDPFFTALRMNENPYTVYLIEIAAIVPFGLFWFIKTAEISLSEFDRKIEEGVALSQPTPTEIGGNKA